jgi:aspartate/methionine/tyrosine aminotransferase
MTSPRFSRRTGWDLAETEWARRLRERRADGLPILDLTASNPTRCGFDYDREGILDALREPAALDYDPNPRGIPTARQAIAEYYADHGATVDPEAIFLATSTSEAYSHLFRLLCDPGDEVLIAQPSYPLFDFLADLNDVRLAPYPLFYDYGWHLDPEALRQKITYRTRAIVVVHPNNPTGHFTKAAEREILEQLCAEHGLALIVDEVFLDYPIGQNWGERPRSFAAGEHPALTFVLSGLSKVAALPQMKVSWIACFGPDRQLRTALERLEVIADTYLSMNAPAQWAFPRWMAGRARIQHEISARVRENLQALDLGLSGQSVANRLLIEGGWYAVLRIPATDSDTKTAIGLLEEFGIAIHSGGFFGFPDAGWLVVSLLGRPDEFLHGIIDLAAYLQRLHER